MNHLDTFLTHVLRDKPDDTYVLLWIIETKESYWVQSKLQIASVIEELIEKHRGKNIYIGCGWTGEDYGRKFRANSTDRPVIVIPGLWVDIDVGTEHKKKNLPPTIEDAQKLLREIVPIPTVVVNSGHGIHMWWLFDQPWRFASDDDRKLGSQLLEAWQSYIRSHFKLAGWDLDGTADLPRVLRPAGTTNYKNPDVPVPVEILYTGNDRYEPEALRNWLKTHATDDVAEKIPAVELSGADFVLISTAEPPALKLYALLSGDVKAKLSWEHKRKDLQDQSQSGYDMSLAAMALRSGWTPQEVINLIVAGRRMHSADLMLENRNYYERTLKAAAKDISERVVQFTEEENAAINHIEELHDSTDAVPEDTKKNLISAINRRLNIGEVPIHIPLNVSLNGHDPEPESINVPALQNIICYTRDPAIYYVQMYNREGELKNISLGDGQQARKQSTWSRVLYDERLKNMYEFNKAEWAIVVNMMAAATERQSAGVEATEQGMATQWINDYCGNEVPFVLGIEERSFWVQNRKPFVEKGRLHFSLSELCVWLRLNRGRNIEEREMAVYVKNIGGIQSMVNFKTQRGNKTTTRMWTVAFHDPSSMPVDNRPLNDPSLETEEQVVEEEF